MRACILLVTPGILSAQLGVTVQRKPLADSIIFVNNYATAPLEAFVLSWESPPEPSRDRVTVTFQDAQIQPSFKAVPPSKQTTVTTRSTISGEPRILAALFQDGVEYGDRDWLAVLRLRRTFYVRAVDAFLAELRLAPKQNLSRAGLLEEIAATREQQLRLSPWLPGPENEQAVDMQKVLALQPGAAWRFAVRGVYTFMEEALNLAAADPDSPALNVQETITLLTSQLNDRKSKLQQARKP